MLVTISLALFNQDEILTAINTVDGRKSNEQGEVSIRVMNTVQGEHHGSYNSHCILATVDQVWKDITSILVSAKTL